MFPHKKMIYFAKILKLNKIVHISIDASITTQAIKLSWYITCIVNTAKKKKKKCQNCLSRLTKNKYK